jgi:hypothetical protein
VDERKRCAQQLQHGYLRKCQSHPHLPASQRPTKIAAEWSIVPWLSSWWRKRRRRRFAAHEPTYGPTRLKSACPL